MKLLLKALMVACLPLIYFKGFAQQKAMPEFRFIDTDKASVGKSNIPKGKGLLLVYFRSDCDHCEHTAIELKAKARQYPTLIWMVSGEELPALQTFESMMGLYDISNLKVLQDKNKQMHTFFNFTQLPYILLYSASGKFVKQFDELPSAEVVKKLLK
jgi:peroxiredoxin